jgi:hypothetical protein
VYNFTHLLIIRYPNEKGDIYLQVTNNIVIPWAFPHMFVIYLINFEDSILRNDIFPNIPSNYLFSLRKNISNLKKYFSISENNMLSVKLARYYSKWCNEAFGLG